MQVGGPERGLVAAHALADLDEHVLAVGGVGLDESQLQLFLEVLEAGLVLGNELPELAVGLRSGQVGPDFAPLLRELVRHLELFQPPADVRRFAMVVVDGRVGQALLRFVVRALEVVDE